MGKIYYMDKDYTNFEGNMNFAKGDVSITTPDFNRITIATDTEATGVLTFTDDISNYDLLNIVLTNSDSGTVTEVLTTPTLINTIYTQENEVVFNEYANTQYGTYRITSATTWTRYNSRNLYISSIEGLTVIGGTIVETMIYNRGSYSTSNVEIAGTDFLNYDMLFVSSTYDGVQPNTIPIVKPFGENINSKRKAILTPYAHTYSFDITNTKMSANLYYYVCGIKFIPTNDV